MPVHRVGSTELCTNTTGFAAAQCSRDNGDIAAHQGAGHCPKGTKRNSAVGPQDRLITGVQQGRGRAMLQFWEARTLLLTPSRVPPLMTLPRVSPTHSRITKKSLFFLVWSRIFCLLFHGLCVPSKSTYSYRCLVKTLTNQE